MKRNARIHSLPILLILLACLWMLPVGAATPEKGHYWDGDAFVARTDTVININRSITLARGFSVGMLDRAVKLKFWLSEPYIEMQLPEDARFSLGEYSYMKIKYCARMVQKTVSVHLTTNTGKNTLTHRLVQDQWVEEIVPIQLTGKVNTIRLSFGSVFKAEYDVMFMEYLAFFRTEAEAEAYGGLTDAQRNGIDPVSIYLNGEPQTTPLTDTSVPTETTVPAPETAPHATTIDPTATVIGVVLGVVAVICIVCICLAAKRKGGKTG